jgi:hypothetical protein
MESKFKKAIDQANDLLDRYILPLPVRFLTFRFVILLTIVLLIPLIVFANNTVWVLAVNSYLNTMGVAVSSIVLLYATVSEARQKQIAELQEKRALEDHMHVTETHNLIMQTLQNQNEEMVELKRVMAALAGKEVVAAEPTQLPDVRSLHPRGKERFAEADLSRRWQASLHHNSLVSSVRKGLTAPVDDEQDPADQTPIPDGPDQDS